MDISAKLNLSYAAVQPVPVVAEKPAAVPQVVNAPASASKADTASSKDSGSGDNSQALKTAVQEIEKFVQSVRRNLEFSIDEASGKVVVKVIASETGEVVRQLPSAEALKIADSLQNAHSLLFDAKV
ncbi:flagellar protein FlaG [Pseudomonas sp. efr-133-TYG-103a]|jgi:flagellar protein FlaG|uniref:flagellar protein FlaG n=1 Tax=Pseudomonas sp. efr-133-TYG-103a TaxID=3040308 RepID=UPI002555521D|nr:flagellar protein FlaG [Pseudomonas sp. efr-133-TYG-103a]